MAAKRYPELLSKDWLARHYTDRELSTIKIAEYLGCTPSAVSVALKRHDIPRRRANRYGSHVNDVRAHDAALVAQLRAEAAKSRAAGFEGVAEGLEEAVRLIGEVAW